MVQTRTGKGTVSEDLQMQWERVQTQREKKIDIIVDEMVQRLNREGVNGYGDMYESIVRDIEKKMKAEFGITQIELDHCVNDPPRGLGGDMSVFLVEWENPSETDYTQLGVDEYTELEYVIGYDEKMTVTSRWHNEANGWIL
jgi:hypothetical protein